MENNSQYVLYRCLNVYKLDKHTQLKQELNHKYINDK